MSEYCLTTTVHSGNGSIQQPGCDWDAKSFGESCAANFEEGTSISLKANPDVGWQVGEWFTSVPGVFVSDPTGSSTAQIIAPSEDVTITVSFVHPSVFRVKILSMSGKAKRDIISDQNSIYKNFLQKLLLILKPLISLH